MEIEKCPGCKGTKEVMGMGCMKVRCVRCAGIGYVAPTTQVSPPVAKAARKKDVNNGSEQEA